MSAQTFALERTENPHVYSEFEGQRHRSCYRSRPQHAVALGFARYLESYRHQIWLGVGMCGACTIHLDGKAVRSCITTVSAGVEHAITTIEGLAVTSLHPVQQAWLDESVPQCGYCQPGKIMSAVALLDETPHPSDAEIDAAFDDHLCRCGTYQRIRRAIHRAAGGG